MSSDTPPTSSSLVDPHSPSALSPPHHASSSPSPLPARNSARKLPPTPTPHNSAAFEPARTSAPPLPPRPDAAPSAPLHVSEDSAALITQNADAQVHVHEHVQTPHSPVVADAPPPLPPRPHSVSAEPSAAPTVAEVGAQSTPPPRAASTLAPPRPRTALPGSASASPEMVRRESSSVLEMRAEDKLSKVLGSDADVSAATTSSSRHVHGHEGDTFLSEAEFNARYNYVIPVLDFGVHREHRDKIAYELLTTETTYVRNMQITLQLWRPALLRAAKADSIPVSESRIELLFSNMSFLLSVNAVLWQALRDRLSAWSPQQKLGDVLTTLAPYLKMYTAYAAAYDSAAAALSDMLASSTRFAALHDALAHAPLSQRMGLSGFLIQPVQRLPRYVLLLSDLLKHTPADHADHADLTAALALMRDVAAHINEAIARAENKAKCVAIQARFPSDVVVVAPHRSFVLEGVLSKQCRKERKPREFFLFNDVLMYAQQTPGNLMLLHCATIDLKQCDVRDGDAQPGEHALQILAPGKSFNVYCANAGEKTRWLNGLRAAIAALRPQDKDKPAAEGEGAFASVWAADSTADACPLCKEKFTFIKRRHHCRSCGRLCCGACSEKRLVVKAVDPTRPVRVCDPCFNEASQKKSALGLAQRSLSTTSLVDSAGSSSGARGNDDDEDSSEDEPKA